MKPILFVLSAPSGGGKTSLCMKLLESFPKELALSISCTTRAPRPGEQEGREYFFISKSDFKDRIQKGAFAEWAEVHDNYYGTSKEFIETTFKSGKSVLLDIDVQGAATLAQLYPKQCTRVFIMPPSIEELENRLRARGTDSEEVIQKRLKNARVEILRKNEFEFNLINDTFDRALQELKSIYLKTTHA